MMGRDFVPAFAACVLSLLSGTLAQVTEEGQTRIVVQSHELRGPVEGLEPEELDFRYSPSRWQTCIGLPDDPYKSLVGSDGGLYYDWNRGMAKFHRFGTRLLADLGTEEAPGGLRQELHSARVPVVTTRSRRGQLELRQIAWASVPREMSGAAGDPQRRDFLWLTVTNTGEAPASGRLRLSAISVEGQSLDGSRSRLVEQERPERVCCAFSPPCLAPAQKAEAAERLQIVSPQHSVTKNWAAPAAPCSDVFRHVVVGHKGPLVFKFAAEPGRRYVAAFGLIEGWYKEPGKRLLDLRIEGKTVREVDLVREHGPNSPVVLPFPAQDGDGDGEITLAIRPVKGAQDQNAILSGLWIFPADAAPDASALLAGRSMQDALGFAGATHLSGRMVPQEVAWDTGMLAPGQAFEVLVMVPQAEEARRNPAAAEPKAELERAVRYWESLDLPYGRFQVPDPAVQGLLDGCVRNLYQAREIVNGHPKFQVGPTCYRGAWAADGAFILETIAYLGRSGEARGGIEAQIDQDDGPGGVEFSKKAGLRLYTLWRHAQLTGDRDWLRGMWPRVEREVNHIKEYRQMTRDDPSAPNYGLTPPGFGDGGLAGPFREYSNVYWTLAGLRAAIEAAHSMKEPALAAAWQAEMDDYWEVFDKARRRDKQTDSTGNTYVPPVMPGEPVQLPQRGAWAFLQSVYPGRVFEPGDALMRGTIGMLDANQREGLIYGTGWIADGIWNYAASFYGHAHLWLGHGRKAAATLYAFGNHASPLLCWREEQNVRGEKEHFVGDMPHNWASAEFIRFVRHLLVLERGNELHLFEGLPQRWIQPGAETRLTDIPTSFGPVSLALRMAADGGSAAIELDPPRREAPDAIVIHTEHLGHRAVPDAPPAIVPAAGPLTLRLLLQR